MQLGKLFYFCGKMGAGKSTESKKVAVTINGVLISEDDWLSALYPEQILSFDDYIQYSNLLKPLIKTHVQHLLRIGTNVVLDFPANTKKQRQWFKQLTTEVSADSELIYLEAENELCLTHIAQRRIEQPSRSAFDTEEVFHHVNQYFEAPTPNEVYSLTVIKQTS